MAHKFNHHRLLYFCRFSYIKNYIRENIVYIVSFYCLYLAILVFSLYIVTNYGSSLTHDNYYQLLIEDSYSYASTSLKYIFYNIVVCFCAMLTYRKKYAFVCMYFMVTFIAYRLAVNIIGSWQYANFINILNTFLFYIPIYTLYVFCIVIIVCYINKYYMYCYDNCQYTIKKILMLCIKVILFSTFIILSHTIVFPAIVKRIFF